MSLSLAYSPWVFVVSVLVAAGLTYWTYRETHPDLSTGWKALLGGLRFVALALLIFLLLEPVAERVRTVERPPVLAVLVDDTQSLRVTGAASDTGDSTAAPRGELTQALDALSAEAVNGERRVYRFSSDLHRLPDTTPVDSLTFQGARTDLAAALQQLREATQDVNLQGVALLSDGQYNTGRNPLYVAERYPVPIHTVTLGDTTRRRDVQVRRITTNDVAYVDTRLPVQVGLRTEDAGGETVTVSLFRGDTRVDQQSVSLPSGTAEVPVDLEVTPTAPGLQQLTVQVSEIDGEATPRNNRSAVTVRVLESKRRVLLLGAAPSPSYAAIRRVLERNRDVDVTARMPKQGGGFYEGPLPDDLSTFDVLVLAGFPSRNVAAGTVDRVAEAIQDGRPALFFLDRRTDLSAWTERFGGALPVSIEQQRSGFTEARVDIVENRRQHPVFQIEDLPPEPFRALPPISKNDSRFQATPDARVLATATVRGVSLNDPVLVVRSRAGQRTAALLATGTWRWSNLPEDLQQVAPLWPGLVSNLLRWVAAREDDRPVRVRPVESTFAGGERVSFTGQVYNESMTAVEDAAVSVTLTAEDDTEYPYTMEPIGNGRYRLDVGVLPEGTYQYVAEAERQGATLGQDRGEFSVGSLTVEFAETRANQALMQQIADRSRGQSVRPDAAASLADALQRSGRFVSEVVEEASESELWHLWIFLALILALLATEWTLRKRMGLA